MSFPTAPLGQNGPSVPRLAFGLMSLSGAYCSLKPDSERFDILNTVYDLGARFWDSADAYGDSEELLGKYFALYPEKRTDIFLATKFGIRREPGGVRVDGSPEYVKEACVNSLKRMGVDAIDLYYCQRLDQTIPIEKTIQAMVELKNEGKIKYLGLSECSAASLRRAHAVHPISAVQMEYSPFALEIESSQTEFLRTCRELGVAVTCYSPLGKGMLTGAMRSPDDLPEKDLRHMIPRWSQENFPKNLVLVDRFGAIAKEKGVTAAQLALAWLLAQGNDIFPTPGTDKEHRLRENIGAKDVVLSMEEEGEIRGLAEGAELAGEKYPEVFQKMLYADTPELEE
ncbi:Aldo/keto reductase [Corynespora cassiicola Philippines]|uniref:Aldo/keto reductase n=1 Tax=Corynespora cassiicola Philippines TaxID=1448308 RepID=A0A2T2NTY2_CORCC|nr:Aldo/keto reductase [Corynespora cassiicola Philippines]